MPSSSPQRAIENNLAFDLYRNARNTPSRIALWVNEKEWTYGELVGCVSQLAGWLRRKHPEGGANIGILANRSAEAYIGPLAALWSGNAYVPLNARLPRPYLRDIIARSDIEYIVADAETVEKLDDLKVRQGDGLVILSPLNRLDIPSGHTAVPANEIRRSEPLEQPVPLSPDSRAYIIFTSGSSGAPKGIAPTVANVACFLDATQQRYRLQAEDRFSQFNDLPWDPSVFDMFSAWKVGASTWVVPERQLFAPAHFIRKHRLSIWYSGPVQISHLQRMGQLKPDSFPSLRLSLFVGEPLLREAASAWQQAARNSLVENVYGPTETTVVCLGQPFSDHRSCITPERNFVAIGTPYPQARIAIVGPEGAFLPDGKVGEIAISGPMVTPGYWKDPELTRERFVRLPGSDGRWYLTGDLGYRAADGIFHFMGRKDNQLQVHGVRVEPEEIEHHLRRLAQTGEVAVIGWPVRKGLVEGLVAFISASAVAPEDLRRRLHEILPAVMVPRKIVLLDRLPRNRNHKIDRNALFRDLENREQTA